MCFEMQVKGGSVFDNILICEDPDYAKQVVEEVFANREVQPFSLAFSVIIDQLNSSSLFEYLFLSSFFFFCPGSSGWKRSIWESRASEKSARGRGSYRYKLRMQFQRVFQSWLNFFLSDSRLKIFLVQEAQRAREEGERRRKERGHDHRYRDRYKDRYRKVCMMWLLSFMIFLYFSICLMDRSASWLFISNLDVSYAVSASWSLGWLSCEHPFSFLSTYS